MIDFKGAVRSCMIDFKGAVRSCMIDFKGAAGLHDRLEKWERTAV
jgi:hypothetical protein